MLEIHEKTDIAGYEHAVEKINVDSIHIVESFNGKEKNGYGIYSVNEDNVIIYDYKSNELDITDGIIRTILFKGMLGGKNRCEFELTDNEKYDDMIKLGFINKNVKCINDISDFMSNCKKCKELR
ncbi:hypothetical protein [Porcipelethomonas sp.]|uniref:hypothetical protein n=1 Tax=Porcipelethomonas sp. TaxID=2981675 RepID=UPI003EF3556C